MSTQLQFSAGLHNLGRFDFTFDVPNGADLTKIQLADLVESLKSAVLTQWDTFAETKVDSMEQVLGRCLLSLNEYDVANTLFEVDLFWSFEEESAIEIAETMGVEISDGYHQEAWVDFKVEFHSVLGQGFFYGAKNVDKRSPTGLTADYLGKDLYSAIKPDNTNQ